MTTNHRGTPRRWAPGYEEGEGKEPRREREKKIDGGRKIKREFCVSCQVCYSAMLTWEPQPVCMHPFTQRMSQKHPNSYKSRLKQRTVCGLFFFFHRVLCCLVLFQLGGLVNCLVARLLSLVSLSMSTWVSAIIMQIAFTELERSNPLNSIMKRGRELSAKFITFPPLQLALITGSHLLSNCSVPFPSCKAT